MACPRRKSLFLPKKSWCLPRLLPRILLTQVLQASAQCRPQFPLKLWSRCGALTLPPCLLQPRRPNSSSPPAPPQPALPCPPLSGAGTISQAAASLGLSLDSSLPPPPHLTFFFPSIPPALGFPLTLIALERILCPCPQPPAKQPQLGL